jgi:hypothetical protein
MVKARRTSAKARSKAIAAAMARERAERKRMAAEDKKRGGLSAAQFSKLLKAVRAVKSGKGQSKAKRGRMRTYKGKTYMVGNGLYIPGLIKTYGWRGSYRRRRRRYNGRGMYAARGFIPTMPMVSARPRSWYE